MIAKDKHGFFEATCDKCNVKADIYGGSIDLRGFVDSVKRLGWQIDRHPIVKEEWTHTCPACQETVYEVDHNGY